MTNNVALETLSLLRTITWDGDLPSKETRDNLYNAGLVQRAHGYNWLTHRGVEYLVNLGIAEAKP